MAKRYTDTTIWKKQKWFRKLPPIYKLAWKYLTDMCDHGGIWKLDFGELIDDLGVDEFDIKDFVSHCNTDFHKENGKKIERERIKLIGNKIIWITGFVKFQYENKAGVISPTTQPTKSALVILAGHGLIKEAKKMGYLGLQSTPEGIEGA